MKLTRNKLIEIIKDEMLIYETTAPDRAITSRILQGIVDSKFWTMPHREYDVELVDKHTFSTPAIEILMDALNDAASNAKTDLYFILSVTDDEIYTLRPDDKFGGYPNNWMMRGQYRGPESGKHIVWLEFRPYSDDYQLSELDPNELVKIISRTINHELVHYYQLKKQASSKGITEEEAWEELLCDPNQIPVSDPVVWEKRCGRKPPPNSRDDRSSYISLHNEIDAFAFEAAEELLDKYSAEEALGLLRTGSAGASKILKDYAIYLKDDNKLFQKFLKKVYSNIEEALLTSVE
jgi:hypothetical protein